MISQKHLNFDLVSFYQDLNFRIANEKDLDMLINLSLATQAGMTSIPKNKMIWETRIAANENFFKNRKKKGTWLTFVLEYKNKVIGMAAVLDDAIKNDPLYVYKVNQRSNVAKTLQIKQHLRYLSPQKLNLNISELGALWLHPKFRGLGLGRFLTTARLLFMSIFHQYFNQDIIAELRGFADQDGSVPFWEGVGRYLYGLSYSDADRLMSQNKRFIQDLLPQDPILLDLLPNSVKNSIGKCHPLTNAAKKILLSEGFEMTRSVDILDAGPKLLANLKSLRIFKESRQLYNIKPSLNLDRRSDIYLLATQDQESFNIKLCFAKEEPGFIRINTKNFKDLKTKKNSTFQAIKLYPTIKEDHFKKEFWACYQNAASLFKTIG